MSDLGFERDILPLFRAEDNVFQFELFHEQLPLPVPCYDLLPVTKFTVGPY